MKYDLSPAKMQVSESELENQKLNVIYLGKINYRSFASAKCTGPHWVGQSGNVSSAKLVINSREKVTFEAEYLVTKMSTERFFFAHYVIAHEARAFILISIRIMT